MRIRPIPPRMLFGSLVDTCRRHRNALIFFCLAVGVAILFLIGTPYAQTPAVVKVVPHFDIDVNDVKQNSLNTIFIEQDDGSVYVAFQLKNISKIVNNLRKKGYISATGDKDLKHEISRITNDDSKSEHLENNKGGNTNIEKRTNHTVITKQKPVQSPKTTNTSAGKNNKITNQSGSPLPKPTFPITLTKNPYTINNENVCKGLRRVSFIVLVHTSTDHFMRRSSIRETWANYHLFTKHDMRIIFLMGMPEKDSTQILIEHESSINKDIIQGNFVDSYRNLTHKGVLGLRWVTEFCSNAKRVVKVDDDVFVNVFKLMKDLDGKFSNNTREIMCSVRPKGTSLIQRESGKWKIDKNEFVNQTHYPFTHCNGFFVIITNDIISDLYHAAFDTPFFWVDDVYLFGALPNRIGNVSYSKLQNLNLNEEAAVKCFESDKPCEFLVANAHTDGIMDKLWFRLLEQYKDMAKAYLKDDVLKLPSG